MRKLKVLGINEEEFELIDFKARPVESIEKMKTLLNLSPGEIIKTLGYYEINDGGGANYLIRNKEESDIEDLGSIHFINDLLVAELIETNVNPIQFGAKCDGEHDDVISIRNAIKYLDSKGGGILNLLTDKIYTLASIENECFIMLKNQCHIIGSSTLKVKDNFGDFRFMFWFDSDINHLILRDFTIDENTRNNPTTSNTGSENYQRTIFRLLAYNNVIDNMLFDNITINDCTGIWQYEFEGKCQNVNINNCKINYNKTENVSYDRTSMYLGVNNCVVSNCILNGSDNARTGIELHGHNIICKNNIINDYNSGFYITNDKTVSYSDKNDFLKVVNNKIRVRGRGIQSWLSFENMITNSIMIHDNFIHMLESELSVNPCAIGNYDELGVNVLVKNYKIFNNVIISENEKLEGMRFVSTNSNINTKIENFEIYNNTFSGVFNKILNLASNANNTFNIDRFILSDNKFIIDNDISSTFYILFRDGIKNVIVNNNYIKHNGTPNYLFRCYGVKDDSLNFNVFNNIVDYDFLVNYIFTGDIKPLVKQKVNILQLTNDNSSNLLTPTKCENGSIIYDNNYLCKKLNDNWIYEYTGKELPVHIPTFKGSLFKLTNHNDFIIGYATNNGYIPDHIAGSNKIGEWVYHGLYVYESLTDNEISTPADDNINFKYVGQKATFNNL